MKPNPIIHSIFPGSVIGAKVDGISLMQVHPLDPHPLIRRASDARVTPLRSVGTPLSSTKRDSDRAKQKPPFSSDEVHQHFGIEARHHFAIEALDKSGPLKSQPYLYTCVRCNWIFRTNDTRGSVIALSGLGRPLMEPENTKRVRTFRHGPCPAFPAVDQPAPEAEPQSRRGFLIRFVEALRAFFQPSGHRSHRRREHTAFLVVLNDPAKRSVPTRRFEEPRHSGRINGKSTEVPSASLM